MLSETSYADVKLGPGGRLPMPDEHEDRGIFIVDCSISVAGQEYAAPLTPSPRKCYLCPRNNPSPM